MMMTVEFEAKDSLICTRACFDEPCTVVDDVRNLAGLHWFFWLKRVCECEIVWLSKRQCTGNRGLNRVQFREIATGFF